MSPDKLRTAVIGLDENGLLLLQAASKSDYYKIDAVADTDSKLAQSTGLKYDCNYYDDIRQLIIQNQFDCVLVAAGIYSCEEYLKAAIKKKTHILKLGPPARSFGEASEFLQLAEKEGVRYITICPMRCSKSFSAFSDYLRSNSEDAVLKVDITCDTGPWTVPHWHTDPKLAGGGVLLRNCYEIIDQMILNFGMGQTVYCLASNHGADRQQRQYLTEDVAAVSIKFSEAFFGVLRANRTYGPKKVTMRTFVKNQILAVTATTFTISDLNGDVIEANQYSYRPQSQIKEILENFALNMEKGQKSVFFGTDTENLLNMALIETAYLSARTAMPEETCKIYELPFQPGVK